MKSHRFLLLFATIGGNITSNAFVAPLHPAFLSSSQPPSSSLKLSSDTSSEVDTIDTNRLYTGRVKWFSAQRGYGFLIPDGPQETRGPEVFAHQSKICMDGFRSLEAKQKVHYRVSKRESDGKLFASEIYKVGSEEDLAQMSAELEDVVRDATLIEADAISAAMEAEETAEAMEAADHDESIMTIASASEIAKVEELAIADEKAAEDLAAHVLPVMAVEEIAVQMEEDRLKTAEEDEEKHKVTATSTSPDPTHPDPFHHLKSMFKF